jgi:hypothetical protein
VITPVFAVLSRQTCRVSLVNADKKIEESRGVCWINARAYSSKMFAVVWVCRGSSIVF